ncbi:MAG TPA: hypothetical protein VIZ21_04450 [Ignavibacteriaceae bacterium]
MTEIKSWEDIPVATQKNDELLRKPHQPKKLAMLSTRHTINISPVNIPMRFTRK